MLSCCIFSVCLDFGSCVSVFNIAVDQISLLFVFVFPLKK